MANSKTSKNLLVLFVCFSVFGFAILFFLLVQSARFQLNIQNSSFLGGIAYSVVCFLGVAAVFQPKRCQKSFTLSKQVNSQSRCEVVEGSGSTVKGHHPDCSEFEGNRIQIRGIVLCSACTGLFLGTMAALVGTILYFFFRVPMPLADLKFLLVGCVAMFLGLAQFGLRGYFKLIVNAVFVVGSFVILVTADLIGKNLLIDFYALGLIVFLLLTRILISEWNNRRICLKCESCKFR